MEMIKENIFNEEAPIFRSYSFERLYIDSIYSKLTTREATVRRAVMECTIDKGEALNLNADLDWISKKADICHEEIIKVVKSIIEKNAMVVDDEGNINYIYPVCALPTNHKVTLKDGRTFNAMCAVDAMGTAFTFKQDIIINSVCSSCQTPVKVEIKQGKLFNALPQDLHILHVDLNKNKNWSGNC